MKHKFSVHISELFGKITEFIGMKKNDVSSNHWQVALKPVCS